MPTPGRGRAIGAASESITLHASDRPSWAEYRVSSWSAVHAAWMPFSRDADAILHAALDGPYVGSVERAERNVSIDNICRLAWALPLEVRELVTPPRWTDPQANSGVCFGQTAGGGPSL